MGEVAAVFSMEMCAFKTGKVIAPSGHPRYVTCHQGIGKHLVYTPETP